MLQMEIIRFEAQDVVTASVAACTGHRGPVLSQWMVGNTRYIEVQCEICGAIGKGPEFQHEGWVWSK